MKIKSLVVGSLLTNCYLVFSKNDLLVVDPGQQSGLIIDEIKKKKKKVKSIVITHYHSDHNQAAEKVKLAFETEILIHKEDANFLNFMGVGADRLIKDRERIEVGNEHLTVIHTPGHTEGSVCLLGDNFIITGDTLFKNGHGRTDLPGGSPYKMKKSLAKIMDLADTSTKIYPGHGESFLFKPF